MRMLLRRFVPVLFVVALSLGCSGVLSDLTDLNIEFKMDGDAVHPADFPVPPVEGAKKTMSMGMSASASMLNLPEQADVQLDPDTNYRMELITYEVPSEQLAATFESAVSALTDAGYVGMPVDEGNASTFRKGGEFFVVVADSTDGSLVLIRIRPVAPATSEE